MGAFRFLDTKTFAEILRDIARHDLIEQLPNGPLNLGIAGEQIARSRDFYSAFATPPEYRVVCDGRPLGMLPLMALPRVEDHLLLAGRRWRVTFLDHIRAEVGVQPAKGRKLLRFCSDSGDLHPRVAQEMCEVPFSDRAFTYLDETARSMLDQARLTAREAGLNMRDLIATSDSSRVWFPWTGSSSLTTLLLIAEHVGLASPEIGDRLSIDFESSAADVIAALRLAIASPPNPLQLAQRLPAKQRRVRGRSAARPFVGSRRDRHPGSDVLPATSHHNVGRVSLMARQFNGFLTPARLCPTGSFCLTGDNPAQREC